jgi:two-component system, sensor histidine kinase YesM
MRQEPYTGRVSHMRRPRKGSKVFAKFALALLALDLVPLTAFSVTMFLAFRDSLARFTIENVERLAEYHAGAVDSMIRSFDATALLVYQYRTGTPNGLADFLGKGGKSLSPQAQGAVDGFLRSMLYSLPSIREVALVESGGRTHQAAREDKAFRLGFDYRSEPWFPGVLAAGKKLSVVPPRVDDAYERSAEMIVTFARNFYDLSTILAEVPERSPAVILIDVDASAFARSLSGLDLGEEGSYRLIDEKGVLMAGSEGLAAGSPSPPPRPDGYRISRMLESRDWRLEIFIARSGIARQAAVVGLYLIIGTLICALGIGALAVVFSRMFSRPLEGVLLSIKGVETGNFDIVVPEESDDEFGALARAFNAMTAELKGYIGREYVARIGRREAELDALRSRLKPHFLANTLEVIRMAAVDARDETAAAMILALSSQLRYALEDGEDEVSLERELEMAQDYYLLMSIRKKGSIAFDVDVPESMRSFRVPKLTLQPLIENAMIHGLGPRLWRGTVRVTASLAEDRFELSVFDDGVGMTASDLAEIRAALERSAAEGVLASGFPAAGFLGLGGIHLRLKLRYGAEAGLDVESAEGMGTVVRATIPVERESPTDAV